MAFFFLTGYGAKGVPDKFKDAPVLAKPCSSDSLKQKINALLPMEKRADVSNDRSPEP